MEQEEGECFSFSLTPPLFGRKRGKNPGEGDSTAEAEKLCKTRSRAKREAVQKEKPCKKRSRAKRENVWKRKKGMQQNLPAHSRSCFSRLGRRHVSVDFLELVGSGSESVPFQCVDLDERILSVDLFKEMSAFTEFFVSADETAFNEVFGLDEVE